MKIQKHTFIFVFLFLLLLTACKPVDLRSQSSESIKIVFNGSQCTPLESIVPPKEDIQLELINNSSTDFTWIIAIFPLNENMTLDDSSNIYFSVKVPSEESKLTEFVSPALPARYDTYCVADTPDQKLILGYLLVVNPDS